MAQIILVEKNSELRKIFSLNLSTFIGVDVVLRENADDVIGILKILPEIELVIVNNMVGEEETAILVHQFIKQAGLNTSLVIIGENSSLSSEVVCLKEPVSWEHLVKISAEHLGISLKEVEQKIRPEYLPVGLFYFYDIEKTPCDVFIRIKKGAKDFQFVKRIHSKDTFDIEVIKKYEAQGLKEFFIPKDYIQYFTTFVTNNLIKKLEREDLSLEDRILTTSNAYDIVKDTIQTMGLDQASIELSETSINSMVTSVRSSPEVTGLLKFLFSSKISYAYQHCHLVALMCHYILSRQSWYKKEHLHVLSFASFFSDVTLKSNQQIQVSSLKELTNAHLDEDEMRSVMNHASDAEKLLHDHPEANDYIKTVILQSHGRTDGIGFEDNPGEDLHPLSKVFMVADNFVKILLNPELPSSKSEILELLGERFTQSSYQKILKALEQKYVS